jgi:nitrile hydratase subunit beta
MNGVHDMGGAHGMGPIVAEKDEPVFHHDWERRVFALALATGFLGKWNIDMGRHAREQQPPAHYLATTYYEHWLFGLQRLLVERGLVSEAELRTGRASGPAEGVHVLRLDQVAAALRNRRAARMPDDVAPRFKPGQTVRARNINPTGHTRLPRYVRGRRGIVDRDHGVFVFADAHAMGRGKVPQHVYSVRFTARELWGADASPHDAVYVDLWDDHLEDSEERTAASPSMPPPAGRGGGRRGSGAPPAAASER